jgi:threonine synthase
MSIWDFPLQEFKTIDSGDRLTLDEGNTPFYFINIGGMQIGVKDENLNPTQSFKDRCSAYQLSFYLALGKKNFVISSSGNAAISVAAFASKYRKLI